MRKAALIVGIIFAVFAWSSVFLRLGDIPGHGLLRVVAAGFFCLAALPLQLIYNLSRNESGLRRTSDIVGTFGMWFILAGLLFKAQSWPGALVVLIAGIVVMAVFAVLFIAASRQPGATTQWFTGFTATALIVLVSLCVSWGDSTRSNELYYEQMLAYQTVRDEYDSKQGRPYEIVLEKDTHGIRDRNDTLAFALYESGMEVLDYIDRVKTGLVRASNEAIGIDHESKAILNGGDTDVPTWYLIGNDLQRPTGEGLYVFDALRKFREDALAETVKFTIPTPAGMEVQDQWVKDNFYHTSVYEALTRLTHIQLAVQRSLITALEQDEYKKEE